MKAEKAKHIQLKKVVRVRDLLYSWVTIFSFRTWDNSTIANVLLNDYFAIENTFLGVKFTYRNTFGMLIWFVLKTPLPMLPAFLLYKCLSYCVCVVWNDLQRLIWSNQNNIIKFLWKNLIQNGRWKKANDHQLDFERWLCVLSIYIINVSWNCQIFFSLCFSVTLDSLQPQRFICAHTQRNSG